MSMAPSYSLSHYICPEDLRLTDFLDMAVEHGFTGVGLTVRALQGTAPQALKGELQARGLSISSVNSAGYFLHAEETAAREQSQRNQWLLDNCVALGGAPLNVIVGGLGHANGRLSIAQARELAAERLSVFAQQAAKMGVPLLFEPIHPMGMWLKGCVHSLRQSLDLIAALPGVSITLDCYHSWWDSDLADVLAREDSPLSLLQVCDVGPWGEEFIPRRLPPGEGVLDLATILRASLQRPKPPQLELELFAQQLQGRPLAQVLKASMRHLASLDRTAD